MLGKMIKTQRFLTLVPFSRTRKTVPYEPFPSCLTWSYRSMATGLAVGSRNQPESSAQPVGACSRRGEGRGATQGPKTEAEATK